MASSEKEMDVYESAEDAFNCKISLLSYQQNQLHIYEITPTHTNNRNNLELSACCDQAGQPRKQCANRSFNQMEFCYCHVSLVSKSPTQGHFEVLYNYM